MDSAWVELRINSKRKIAEGRIDEGQAVKIVSYCRFQ
jgi:hypothetical protein